MSRRLRVLITGIGGQGVLTAGRWLGDAAHASGVPVCVGQIHGMSQRGGAVQATVVLGGARSAAIPDGGADALVALEPMEAARALAKISRRTTALVNTRPVLPSSLQLAGRPYPPLESLIGPIAEAAARLVELDATQLAEKAGSARALNVVMLGMLAGAELLPFPVERLLGVVLDAGVPVLADVARTAFRYGEDAVRQVRAR